MHSTSIINICSFPHPISQVADQINFLTTFLTEHALQYQISNSLSTDKFNILIEGFSSFSVEHIKNFCKHHNIKVAVIVTEDIKIVDALNFKVSNKDTLSPHYRFYELCKLLPITCFFITLNHSNLKTKLNQIFPSSSIIEIPTPKTDPSIIAKQPPSKLPSMLSFYFDLFHRETA